jgi:hypothetical protein
VVAASAKFNESLDGAGALNTSFALSPDRAARLTGGLAARKPPQ